MTDALPSDALEAEQTRAILLRLLARLNARQRMVIELRYGLHADEPMMQRDIAQMIGVTAARIGQIERRALRWLRLAAIRHRRDLLP